MLRVIKNQKYQTRREVIRAANAGSDAAIRGSIRHWKELATAPVCDLISYDSPGLGTRECALCERYDFVCCKCPLYVKFSSVKCYELGQLYTVASAAITRIREPRCSKATRDKMVKRFRRAAEKLIKVLESCLEN